jgi:anti-anti-sigma factor
MGMSHLRCVPRLDREAQEMKQEHMHQQQNALRCVHRANRLARRGTAGWSVTNTLTAVHLSDSFRFPCTSDLRHRVRSLLRRGERAIVLDLARVSSIDAAGIGELVRAYNITAAMDGELRIMHATKRVRELLERAGLFDRLTS